MEQDKKATKLERLEARRDQLNAQIKRERARENAKERKHRTRELIQLGAIVSSALDLELNEATRNQVARALNERFEDGSKRADHLRADILRQSNEPLEKN